MDDTASKSGMTKLDLDNYHTWSVQVKCWLVTKGLFKWTHESPKARDGAIPAADRDNDAKALAYIGMTLTEQYLPNVNGM